MHGMTAMVVRHPQFESLANHQSGVKLITLGAVSWRQPGDIYLWTHVSNLAITVALINSLPESLPGEQEFRDSDRLMMLVSCNSTALKLYSDYACVKNKTIQINGVLWNVMIYMNHCLWVRARSPLRRVISVNVDVCCRRSLRCREVSAWFSD